MVRARAWAVDDLRAYARREVRDQHRHDREEDQRRDVGRIRDREGVERRKEEEVVGERRRDDSYERGPEAEADRHGDDGRQEHEVDVFESEEGLDRWPTPRAAAIAQKRHGVRNDVKRRLPLRFDRLLGNRLALVIARNHMNADIARAANEIVDDRPVEDLEPARARGLSDDDLGDIVCLGEAKTSSAMRRVPPGIVTVSAPSRSARRRVSAIRSRCSSESCSAALRLDVESRPGRVQPVGEALGIAHEAGGARVLADADEHPLASGPGPGDRVGLHMRQELLVDPLRRCAAAPVRAGRSGCRARSSARAPAWPAPGRRPCLPSAAASDRPASGR